MIKFYICLWEQDAAGSNPVTRTKNRQVSYETCRFLILFSCFFANLVFEQDSHVVPAAIQNTVNVDVVPIHPVEDHIVSADKEAIIAVYICDGGKRCAGQRVVTEHTNCFVILLTVAIAACGFSRSSAI